jgi:hypothetical protein
MQDFTAETQRALRESTPLDLVPLLPVVLCVLRVSAVE